jgi:hypothetical protein
MTTPLVRVRQTPKTLDEGLEQIKNKLFFTLFTAVPPCSGTMGIVAVETARRLETIAFDA